MLGFPKKMENKKNIVLTAKIYDGESYRYEELVPNKNGDSYPLYLNMDSNGSISWSDSNPFYKEIKEKKDQIELLEKTVKELFKVVEEQQERIDDLTDSLNKIINYLK